MNADVKASTQIFGVIGFPVAHSLSPRMQNAALQAAGIDGVYVAFPVEPRSLTIALAGLQALGVKGMNVTVPHKEEAARWVESLTPEAKRAGAVNTIAFRNGRSEGHNTDGLGFLRAAERLVGPLRGKRILILGAGGAGRGVTAAAHVNGVEVLLANRTREKAIQAAGELAIPTANVREWSPRGLQEAAGEADLVVNASSAGMHGKGEIPLRFADVPSRPAAIDLVYAPLETGFLRQAKAAGCKVQDGLSMLAAQGELAFEFWTGIPAPQGVMEKALREAY